MHEKTCGRGSAVAEGIRKRTIILLSQHICYLPKRCYYWEKVKKFGRMELEIYYEVLQNADQN